VTHYDETTLALLALGETQLTPDNAAHLSTCARCQSEVDQLGAVVAIGRSVQDDDYPVAPPAAVWDRIMAEVHRDPTPATAESSTAGVVELDSRGRRARSRRWATAMVAAAAGLIVGIGGTWTLTRSATPASQPTASGQVSVVALKPLDVPAASGTAVLRVVSADKRTVTLTVANLPTVPATFYEVWLIDLANSHLVSLGVLGADGRGAYLVPPGLDLTAYSAVDVSLQQMNGSPEHSKKSAVRGTIST
jgi:anti-sigma-K factor RskA